MHDSSYIARCAQLALILEVTANPKPGNIDREHDYKDTRFEHFLASAVGAYPVFEQAARSKNGIGALISAAVEESVKWHKGGNTHFGAYTLLIPLIMSAGISRSQAELKQNAIHLVRNTTSRDAIEFYKAFSRVKVRVKQVDYLDVNDPSSIKILEEKNLSLYEVMKLSCDRDLIAEEWCKGFPRSFNGALLLNKKTRESNVNDAIVQVYLQMLSEEPDTFIEIKFGKQKALWVSQMASLVLKDKEQIKRFDEQLIREGINPGSTADIIAASLFIALLGGMRF
ncbi:MAG: triphosphoribosyl-dephospho-CoA synthase [Methanocellales archaeon]